MASFPEKVPDWANLSVLHRNTLPPRSHFDVFNSKADALSRDAAKARSQCLSGSWKFHICSSPLKAPDVPKTNEDIHAAQWSDVEVPGMWQLQGFGRGPHYTNVQFPFFVDPPFPPYTDNECGTYARAFTVPDEFREDQLRLRFEGVDSSFHVWINGREVGYSQGSRNASEFDVSGFVQREGANSLVVRVYQFCDGSYIEDQDQWWLSGIFRDVFLLGLSRKARFEDFDIRTVLDGKYEDADLKVQINVTASAACNIDVELLDDSGKQVARASEGTDGTAEGKPVEFSMHVQNPYKWTAETPYLYRLVASIDGTQFVCHRIGFRQVELKDGLIKINGKRVVFKGANRHEHHPRFGRAVPFEFLKTDLLLMKTHNINSIRTSHQPNDPRLYDLADELGIWVLDEADLECHGFETIEDASLTPEQRSIPFFKRQLLTRKKAAQWTSDNPDWHDAYVDRAKQLVHRDKLHPSIVIWSLGNEAFYGRNHTAMRDWIKNHDPTRLIHYEPDLEAEHMDMYSVMYPHLERIIEFAKDKTKAKPLVLCEYIHAMGTGPGNIKEYIDLFYKYPTLQGGWVWEWANHGLLTKSKEGESYYGYGGDFGDVPNDSNFVMDGVLDSDHTPNSGLVEYKKALEPVQYVRHDGGRVEFVNRYDFATLDHLKCVWSCVTVGAGAAGIDKGEISIPQGAQPGDTCVLTLPDVKPSGDGEAHIELSFQLREDTNWARAGEELAFAQIPIASIPPLRRSPPSADDRAITVERVGATLDISASQSKWSFDLVGGKIASWSKADHRVIVSPLEPSFYRAPTDNDASKEGRDWKERELPLARINTRQVDWCRTDAGSARVTVEQKFAPPVLSWSFDLKVEYLFHPSGEVEVHVHGEPAGRNLPKTLPRIGVTVGLDGSFQEVKWLGRGPGESYKDMKLSQKVGAHRVDRVGDLWAEPEFPQECSNRTDTRELTLASSSNASLTVQFLDLARQGERKLFDFMASHYRVADIDEAKHPYELHRRKQDQVVLRLDADHHGLGTGSCGPTTLEQYALKTDSFGFAMLLS